VRAYETAGRGTSATLNLKFAGTQWSGSFHPYEIKTLRINHNTHAIKEVNALEE
jgi:alpha-mannosidase